jgi:hypothetical protein
MTGTSAHELFDALAEEHGGVAALGIINTAIVRTLARELASDTVDARAVAELIALLPPKPVLGGILDLGKLDDGDLDALEGMIMRAGTVAPPEAGSDAAMLREALALNGTLQGLVDRADERAETAEASEAMYRRLLDGTQAECEELRRRLVVAPAATLPGAEHPAEESAHPEPRQEQGEASQKPSNVVPIRSEMTSVWAGVALASDPGASGGPPGVLFDASDPSGKGRGMP